MHAHQLFRIATFVGCTISVTDINQVSFETYYRIQLASVVLNTPYFVLLQMSVVNTEKAENKKYFNLKKILFMSVV